MGARRALGLALALLSLGLLLRCGGQGGVEAPAPQGEVLVRIVWASGESRVIPPDVQAFYIQVSAADISPPITGRVEASEVVGGQAETLLYIPPGANRLISVEARDAGGRVLAEGSATVQIFAAQTTQVNIVLGETQRAQLLIHPSDLFFEWDENQKTFYIGNTGVATLNWSLTIPPEATWLSVVPTSGSVDIGAEQAIAVTVSRTGPPEGDYSATISVTSNGGDGSVAVRVYIAKIAFTSNRDGDRDAYVMNADGTNVTQLTDLGSIICVPAWSPDGAKLLVQRCASGESSVWSVNADGSNLVQLVAGTGWTGSACWSADGSKITFTSQRDGNSEIYVMDSDGGNQVNLTNNPAYDSISSWSPDGSKIAFTSDRDGNREVYVMNSDGTDQTRLTNSPEMEWQVSWSPDGTKILFNRQMPPENRFDIFIMNADGSDPTPLTTTPSDQECAYSLVMGWSPGGSTIAYHSCIGVSPTGLDIFAVGINGYNPRRLTNLGSAFGPSWSPDGSRIAFSHSGDIYTVDPYGANLTQITSTPDSDSGPRWRPLPQGRRTREPEDQQVRLPAPALGKRTGVTPSGDVHGPCGKGPCFMMGKMGIAEGSPWEAGR